MPRAHVLEFFWVGAVFCFLLYAPAMAGWLVGWLAGRIPIAGLARGWPLALVAVESWFRGVGLEIVN